MDVTIHTAFLLYNVNAGPDTWLRILSCLQKIVIDLIDHHVEGHKCRELLADKCNYQFFVGSRLWPSQKYKCRDCKECCESLSEDKGIDRGEECGSFSLGGEPWPEAKLHPRAGGYVSPKYLRCMGETRVWVGDAEVNLGLTTPVAEGTSVLALSEAVDGDSEWTS